MGYSASVYIFLVAFFAFACGSSEPKTVSKNISKKDSLQTTDAKDTMPPVLPPPPAPAPAPGTMRLQGKVTDIHQVDNDSSVIYDIKALKILGIGSSTPAIVLNDTLQILSSLSSKNIKIDAKVTCTIQTFQAFAVKGEKQPPWQLLRWEYIPDQK